MTSLYKRLLPSDASANGLGHAALATHCYMISQGFLPESLSILPPELTEVLHQDDAAACLLVYQSATSGRNLTLTWTAHDNTLAICSVLEKTDTEVAHVGTMSLQMQTMELAPMMKVIEREMGKLIGSNDKGDDKEVQTEPREEVPNLHQIPRRPNRGDPEGGFEGMLVGPNSRLFNNPVPGSRFDPIFPDNPLGMMNGDDVYGTLPHGANIFSSRRGGRFF